MGTSTFSGFKKVFNMRVVKEFLALSRILLPLQNISQRFFAQIPRSVPTRIEDPPHANVSLGYTNDS